MDTALIHHSFDYQDGHFHRTTEMEKEEMRSNSRAVGNSPITPTMSPNKKQNSQSIQVDHGEENQGEDLGAGELRRMRQNLVNWRAYENEREPSHVGYYSTPQPKEPVVFPHFNHVEH